MTHYLAAWTPEEVLTVLAAVAGFITATLTPFLFWLFGQIKAIRQQNAGQQEAIEETKAANIKTTDRIIDVAKALPAAPTPEAVAKAMTDANKKD